MAVPKRRKSKSKIRIRKFQDALKISNLRPCPRCGLYILSHRVCYECGHYKGQLIIEPKVKIKETK